MRYHLTINGKFVAYLKRVKHGEPALRFEGEHLHIGRDSVNRNLSRATYDERIAKGWFNTCRRHWGNERGDNVALVPVSDA